MGSTPVAVFTADPAAPTGNPLVYTIHTDHLDTPRVVLDKNGAVRWRWMAEPFGATAPETNPSNLGAFTLNLRFPGQYADQESGLFYNYYRDLDPTISRYAESDPIGLKGGINTYAYVDSDPISAIDPEGLAACRVLFPDYPIEYSDGKTSTWLGGHGGVVGYDSSGATQYYEYGRYSPNSAGVVGAKLPADAGNVRRVSVPNVSIGKDGQPTPESMNSLRIALSQKAGKGTEAELTCDAKADEKKVYEYAMSFARNPNRPHYNWKPWSANQCRTFARDAFNAGR
jgi:RHS repeat-associated protein